MDKIFKSLRPYLFYSWLFSFFINILQLTFPIYMLQIYDRVLSSYSLPTLYVLTLAAVMALIVMGSLEFVRSRLLVRCGVSIEQAISKDVLDEMLKQATLFGVKPNQANLRDVNLLRNFFAGNSVFMLFDIPWTPLFLGMIYLLHPMLGMVATGGAVLLIVFAILNEWLTRKPLNAANTVSGYSGEFVNTARRNAHSVSSMGMLGGVTERWQQLNDTVVKLQTQASRQAGMIQSLSSWLRQSMQVFIYGVGAWLTLKGESTAGCMIAASIIMGRALTPVQMGISTWKNMIEARGAWQRMDQLFKERTVKESMELPDPLGQLSAEGVSFVTQKSAIIKDVSFRLEAGESLGLVGPSGAGKSTLCRLLLGLWPASAGSVRLDGADIFSWRQEKLGPFIGYLPQEVELFSATVAENIARMGTVDSEKVVLAAQMAGTHDMILRFPEGYDTRIGPGGVILSGGQRQSLGLARALYGVPKILVLDEPDSSLDDDGEQALLQALQKLKENRVSVIMVSHKPSLLAEIDKILVLKEGRAVMFGPREAVFRQLMQQRNAGSAVVPKA